MRARILLLIVIGMCGVAVAGPASAEERVIDTQRSTLTVHVFKAGLLRAFADDHVIQAPLLEGSLEDSATLHVQIAIDARRMRVLDPGLSEKDRQEVQMRMLGPEVLDVNRYSWISYHSLTIEPLERGGWLVRGELELHGRIRPLVVKVSRENTRYKGSATVRQSDFGIVPIGIAGGTVKVKDEIAIDFDIAMTDRRAGATRTRFLLPVQLAAQAPPAIDVGARIRAWTPELRKLTGRVEALTVDTLVLQPDDTTASVSMPIVTLVRIEISRGLRSRRNSAWRHAKWGAVIGAVPGAISLGLQHEQIGGGSSVAKAAALGVWSGGLFGGLIGAMVGAAHPGENWERLR